ncbi:MAG: DUF4332 domain-containing protein [Bacillota bacterium]
MYSIDLEDIPLDEFKQLLESIDLLPGRKVLLDGLAGVITRLKKRGVLNLSQLQQALKNKKKYPELQEALSVTNEYLVILNREINSYVSKPIPLAKLGILTEWEIKNLQSNEIHTTKELYESCRTKASRKKVALYTNISEERMEYILQVIDLIRINGVGPSFAKILNRMGIKKVEDYVMTDSQEILRDFREMNKGNAYAKVKLGLKDIEYCKRFARKLKTAIEW